MKSTPIHLFYGCVLLGCVIYFCVILKRENALLEYLARSISAMEVTFSEDNQRMKAFVAQQAIEYANESNLQQVRYSNLADSLIKLPFTGGFEPNQLRERLLETVDRDRYFVERLPREMPFVRHPRLPFLEKLENRLDTLKRQTTLNMVLKYHEIKVSGPMCRFGYFRTSSLPVLICPNPGQISPLDICLSGSEPEMFFQQISVNGQILPSQKEVAHFEHTFTEPGLHELKVEGRARYKGWYRDSSVTATKSFLINVTR